jgi:hypothetical protein
MKFQAITAACFLTVALAQGAENALSHKGYSQEDLVAARTLWLYQEARLKQLKFEAKNLTTDATLQHVAGVTHIATINATNETIQTHIGKEKSVTLGYKEFDALLQDKMLFDLATKRKEEKGDSLQEQQQILSKTLKRIQELQKKPQG